MKNVWNNFESFVVVWWSDISPSLKQQLFGGWRISEHFHSDTYWNRSFSSWNRVYFDRILRWMKVFFVVELKMKDHVEVQCDQNTRESHRNLSMKSDRVAKCFPMRWSLLDDLEFTFWMLQMMSIVNTNFSLVSYCFPWVISPVLLKCAETLLPQVHNTNFASKLMRLTTDQVSGKFEVDISTQ